MGNDRIEFEEIKAIALKELDNSKNLNEWLDKVVQGIYQKGKEIKPKESTDTEEFEGTYYCRRCHSTVLKTDQFCHECGRTIIWGDGYNL